MMLLIIVFISGQFLSIIKPEATGKSNSRSMQTASSPLAGEQVQQYEKEIKKREGKQTS